MGSFTKLIQEIDSSFIEELLALKGIPQDAKRHPEGDAFIHTMLVIDEMEHILDRAGIIFSDYYIIMMNAAICHDLGKVSTTVIHEDGRITSYDHDNAGVEPTVKMLKRCGVKEELLTPICNLVRYHMAHIHMGDKASNRAIKRLARKLMPATIEMWALLVLADHSGRPPLPKEMPSRAQHIVDIARELGINEGIIE